MQGFFIALKIMAIYRKIHVSFWSDAFISELLPEQRYFYIYLLTNEKTKQCGIYEITKKQICNDTGYNIDRVSKLLEYFIKKGKIRYSDKTNELAVKNWRKYNYSTSPKVQSCINKELTQIKDRVLIEYINSMDTESQEEEEEEEEETQEQKEGSFVFEIYTEEKSKKNIPPSSGPPLLIYPWNTERFIQAWAMWIKYKKEDKKFTYKSIETEQIALKELTELANGKEETAIRIIQKSIASGWAGLFKFAEDKRQSITADSLRESDELIRRMSGNG